MFPVSERSILSSRIKLLAIVALVVLPIFSAWVLYYHGSGLVTLKQTNRGKLIVPPIAFSRFTGVETVEHNGHWTLLLLGRNQCDQSCQRMLYYCRQVHIALGKDADRVQRVYVSSEGSLNPQFESLLASDYPLLSILYEDKDSITDIFGVDWQTTNRVYLVDPMGNIMMEFTADQLGKPMLQDLKRLLKISKLSQGTSA